MERRETQTIARQPDFYEFSGLDRDSEIVRQRLETLLALNYETARQKAMYRSDAEKLAAEMMPNPYSLEKSYSLFGLLLGTLPPAALFIRFAIDARVEAWIFGIMLVINLITGVVGYFSGRVIAKIVRHAESLSWLQMVIVLPFLGLLWGIVTGGTGGIIVFVIGAFFGAVVGGLVGGFALPVFTILHRWLKKGESIERRHFLPLAFGVTLIVCGFILGL